METEKSTIEKMVEWNKLERQKILNPGYLWGPARESDDARMGMIAAFYLMEKEARRLAAEEKSKPCPNCGGIVDMEVCPLCHDKKSKPAPVEANGIAKEVSVICQELKNDKGLWIAYQSNIAMAIFDEMSHNLPKNNKELHELCNKGAIRFLELWTNNTAPVEDYVFIPVDLPDMTASGIVMLSDGTKTDWEDIELYAKVRRNR